MSFDKFWSLWKSSKDGARESLRQKTQGLLSSSLGLVPQSSTTEFDEYLSTMPVSSRVRNKKSSSNHSLYTKLVKKCYENVQPDFLNPNYAIQQQFFKGNIRSMGQRQLVLQDQLDEVEFCLFNQVSNRFDEILAALRTFESLEGFITDNCIKVSSIRQLNFKRSVIVIQKQRKISAIIRRKQRIEAVLKDITKLRRYASLIDIKQRMGEQADSAVYETISNVQEHKEQLLKLTVCADLETVIQQCEFAMQRNFSDQLNAQIYGHARKQLYASYNVESWRGFEHRAEIFEQRSEVSLQHTAILDSSGFLDKNFEVPLKRDQQAEDRVLESVTRQWSSGEYDEEMLVMQLRELVTNFMSAFTADFRNFCDQVCGDKGIRVQNPSLKNLLKPMSLSFCGKVFIYYFDLHKSLLLWIFCLTGKIAQFISDSSNYCETIGQMEKLNKLLHKFMSLANTTLQLVSNNLVQLLDTKELDQTIDMDEFKGLTDIYDYGITFIHDHLLKEIVEVSYDANGPLAESFKQLNTSFKLECLSDSRSQKILSHINKMHQNCLNVELKQSLQNQAWTATDVPTFYYDSLHYLMTGESFNLRKNRETIRNSQSVAMFETSVMMDPLNHNYNQEKSILFERLKKISDFRIIRTDIIIEGKVYRVTQTVLLLVQMIEDYLLLASNYPEFEETMGLKLNELIRSYNSSSCQLILHAGAVALKKIKTKNITSKHLSLSTLCLSFIIYIIECIQKRTHVSEAKKLKDVINEHIGMNIKKLNQIIMFKVRSAVGSIDISRTPSQGTQDIVSNTKILYGILSESLDRQMLSAVITPEFFATYVDAISKIKVQNRLQAEALKDDTMFYFDELTFLETVVPEQYSKFRLQAEAVIKRVFEQL